MIIREIDDYIGELCKWYPSLSEDEIRAVLKHGFAKLYELNRQGGDVNIRDWRCLAYFGYRFTDIPTWIRYRCSKYRRKLRMTYNYTYQQFDGNYYFGVTEEEYQKYRKSTKKYRYVFHNVILFKIPEECFMRPSLKHFFQIYYPIDIGFQCKKDKIASKNYKYFAYRKHKQIVKL